MDEKTKKVEMKTDMIFDVIDLFFIILLKENEEMLKKNRILKRKEGSNKSHIKSKEMNIRIGKYQ